MAWDIESLLDKIEEQKEFFLDKLKERDKRYQQRFEAQEKNIKTALIAQNRRLDGMNEFRQTLSDQSNTFLPRLEYKTAHESLVDKIDALTLRITAMDSQTQGANNNTKKIYAAIAAVGVILGIIVLLANNVF